MASSLFQHLKRFSLAQRGAAFVEFALAFPLLITLLIGVVEITNFVFAYNKAEYAAAVISNVLARGDMTTEQVDDLLVAVNPLMEPFDFSEPGNGVLVTAFGVDQDTGDPEILWTRGYKSPGTGMTPDELSDRITMNAERNETLVVVQVFYKFTPMMTQFLFEDVQVDVLGEALALPRDKPIRQLSAMN